MGGLSAIGIRKSTAIVQHSFDRGGSGGILTRSKLLGMDIAIVDIVPAR